MRAAKVILTASCVVLMFARAAAPAGSAAQPPDEPAGHPELLVSGQWLARHLGDADLVVLCVAQAPEFCSAGHIPGARFVSLGDLVERRGAALHAVPPPEKLEAVFRGAGVNARSRIVLYGERLGLCAARAFFTLDYLGAANPALLDGGLEAWKREGRPLSFETVRPLPGDFAAHVHPEVLLGLDEVRALSASLSQRLRPAAALLDARPPEEFSGARASEDVPRPGHIPGAACLYWMNLLESPANPVLKSPSELRRVFEAAGAPSSAGSAQVVTYCRTGMQSSMDYFVARYLGYRAAMYPASFYEWSRAGAPVQADK